MWNGGDARSSSKMSSSTKKILQLDANKQAVPFSSPASRTSRGSRGSKASRSSRSKKHISSYIKKATLTPRGVSGSGGASAAATVAKSKLSAGIGFVGGVGSGASKSKKPSGGGKPSSSTVVGNSSQRKETQQHINKSLLAWENFMDKLLCSAEVPSVGRLGSTSNGSFESTDEEDSTSPLLRNGAKSSSSSTSSAGGGGRLNTMAMMMMNSPRLQKGDDLVTGKMPRQTPPDNDDGDVDDVNIMRPPSTRPIKKNRSFSDRGRVEEIRLAEEQKTTTTIVPPSYNLVELETQKCSTPGSTQRLEQALLKIEMALTAETGPSIRNRSRPTSPSRDVSGSNGVGSVRASGSTVGSLDALRLRIGTDPDTQAKADRLVSLIEDWYIQEHNRENGIGNSNNNYGINHHQHHPARGVDAPSSISLPPPRPPPLSPSRRGNIHEAPYDNANMNMMGKKRMGSGTTIASELPPMTAPMLVITTEDRRDDILTRLEPIIKGDSATEAEPETTEGDDDDDEEIDGKGNVQGVGSAIFDVEDYSVVEAESTSSEPLSPMSPYYSRGCMELQEFKANLGCVGEEYPSSPQPQRPPPQNHHRNRQRHHHHHHETEETDDDKSLPFRQFTGMWQLKNEMQQKFAGSFSYSIGSEDESSAKRRDDRLEFIGGNASSPTPPQSPRSASGDSASVETSEDILTWLGIK